MGYDISVYLEQFNGREWCTPSHLKNLARHNNFDPLYIFSIEDKSFLEKLFFGNTQIPTIKYQLPDDLSPSIKETQKKYHYSPNDLQGWILLKDLFEVTWTNRKIILESKISASLANLFKDGLQAFPESLLKERGVLTTPVYNDYKLTTTPQDWTDYKKHQLISLPPTHLVRITWTEFIYDFINDDDTIKTLKALEEIPEKENYRLIMWLT